MAVYECKKCGKVKEVAFLKRAVVCKACNAIIDSRKK